MEEEISKNGIKALQEKSKSKEVGANRLINQ